MSKALRNNYLMMPLHKSILRYLIDLHYMARSFSFFQSSSGRSQKQLKSILALAPCLLTQKLDGTKKKKKKNFLKIV
jgi:hypothetical protein